MQTAMLPPVIVNGEPNNNSYIIYHLDDLILYRFTSRYGFGEPGKKTVYKKRHQYFVFQKDSLSGLNYTSALPRRVKGMDVYRVLVDSIKQHTIDNLDMSDSIEKVNPGKVRTIPGGGLVKVFKVSKTAGNPQDFTYSYYYSAKFNKVRDRWAKRYDTLNGRKLFKVVFAGSGGYYKKEKAYAPSIKYTYEMKTVPAEDIKTAEAYFLRYKDYCNNGKAWVKDATFRTSLF
jgi:hypothetical protein